MNAEAWLLKAQRELDELRSSELEGVDAWRALALDARLRLCAQSPTYRPLEPHRALSLLQQVVIPNSEDLVETLGAALESGEDPLGSLLDAVLDLDDTVGILTCQGRAASSESMAVAAAALISLFPERCMELVPFAQSRLETLDIDALPRRLWEAVEQAPVELLREGLTPDAAPVDPRLTAHAPGAVGTTAASGYPPKRPRVGPRLGRWIALPMEHFQAAAQGHVDREDIVLRTSGMESATLFREMEGGWTVDLRLGEDQHPPKEVHLALFTRTDRRLVAHMTLSVERDGRDLYVKLPSEAGLPSQLKSELTSQGLELADVEVEILLDADL